MLKSPVSMSESSLRGSIDVVSKKTSSETGFCHIAEGLLRQDCSFDSLGISSVATESSSGSKICYLEFIYPFWPLGRSKFCTCFSIGSIFWTNGISLKWANGARDFVILMSAKVNVFSLWQRPLVNYPDFWNICGSVQVNIVSLWECFVCWVCDSSALYMA